MANQININSNPNKINLEDVNPKIIVRDENKNTTVNVESKNTSVVKINTPGPRGPQGEQGIPGPSGSATGVTITDNDDNEKKKILFVIEQSGGSGTTGSLGVDSSLQAFSFNPSQEVFFSSNISSSGFINGASITSSVGVLITSSTSLLQQNPFLIKFDDGNGQPEKFSVSSSGIVRFGALDTLPTPVTGGFAYSASNFYAGI